MGLDATADVPLATTDAAPDQQVGNDVFSLLPLGALCQAGSSCTSKNCVDGVCCDTSCTGCNACSNTLTGKADGTCSPVITGKDPHDFCSDETATKECGNDGTCDGAGACRKVSTSHVCTAASCSAGNFTPDSTCDGLGACKTVTPQNCGAFQCDKTGCLKTCTAHSDCDTISYCNSVAGKCAAKGIAGTPASQTYECLSGVVADGVCCEGPCTGCRACTNALTGGAAGQCLPILAGKVAHNACTASGTSCGLDGTCDGAGACSYLPKEGASCDDISNRCITGRTCQNHVCTAGTTKTCEAPSDQCHTAGTCDPATGICSNPVKNGAACGTASCVSDSQGNVSYTPLGTCNVSGICTPGTSGACPGFAACASWTTCKSATCSTSNDCAAGYYCTGSGGSCTAKKSTGLSCGSAGQCSSNYCVDGVCCGTACNLASAASGSCMGCSNAATGGPNGTCAARNGMATHACPVSNPTACVNLQTDPDNCASCGHICPSGGLPSGATRSCILGSCGSVCSSGNQVCVGSSGAVCSPSVWGFEDAQGANGWIIGDGAGPIRTSSQHHSGSWSLSLYPLQDNYSYITAELCSAGSMNVAGRTVSAWIFVDANSSIIAGSSCTLYASGWAFDYSATRAPPPSRTWFLLTGTYPSTATPENNITLSCAVPADTVWYIDDVRID